MDNNIVTTGVKRSRYGREIRVPDRFVEDINDVVIGKDEKKYRDNEDYKCVSDSEDDDSTGSLVEFVISDNDDDENDALSHKINCHSSKFR